MEITIKGNPEEIAALVLAAQGRHGAKAGKTLESSMQDMILLLEGRIETLKAVTNPSKEDMDMISSLEERIEKLKAWKSATNPLCIL